MLRDVIEHRLLAYGFVDGSHAERLCHTVALIFAHCVIYPLPNRAPLEILLDRLVALLSALKGTEDESFAEEFLAWAMLIGAMACGSVDDGRILFFLAGLRSLAGSLGVASWQQLKSLVGDFLWLHRACDAGGSAVWEMLFQ
jgi:hypothetical protein